MSYAMATKANFASPAPWDDSCTMFPVLQATFGDTPTPVWVTDLEGRRLYTNPAGAEMLGGDVDVGADQPRGWTVGTMLEEITRGHRPVERRAEFGGRVFEVLLSPLQNHLGRTVAALTTLRPVS